MCLLYHYVLLESFQQNIERFYGTIQMGLSNFCIANVQNSENENSLFWYNIHKKKTIIIK